MKIIHLSSEYPPQKVFGLGRYVHDLSVAQAEQGHEVHVITNSMGGKHHKTIDCGVHVHRVDYPPLPKPVYSGSTVTQFNTQIMERLFRDEIGLDADIINAHDWLTAFAGKFSADLLNKPFVITIHDLIVGKRLNSLKNSDKYIGNIEHWAVNNADKVICVSEAQMNEVVDVYDAKNNLHAIHNAVDPERFTKPDADTIADFRNEFAANDERIILYVGRLDIEKGVDVLLKAFAELQNKCNNTKLILAGSGMGESSLQDLVKELNIQDRVQFFGYADSQILPLLYHSADLQVIPSLYEPFGIVALEGMACGLPVIASDIGGLKETIRDGKTGILVESGNHQELATSIERILNDKQLTVDLGKTAKKHVEKCFSWKHVAQSIDTVYQEAVKAANIRNDSKTSDKTSNPSDSSKVPNSLRFLFLMNNSSSTSPETDYQWAIARTMAEYGNQVHIVVKDNINMTLPDNQNIFVHTLDNSLPVKHYDMIGDAVLNNIRALAMSMEIEKQYGKFDIVISYDWTFGHAAKSFREISAIPWHLIVAKTENDGQVRHITGNMKYISEMRQWCEKHADHTISISRILCNDIIRDFNISKNSMRSDSDRFMLASRE